MCTVTWWRTSGGYEIFFNRDERRTRKPARAPSVHTLHTTRYVAPEDGDAGGSWIGANEYGLSLCLLNHYSASAADAAPGRISRGLLLTSLMDAASVADVSQRLKHVALADYSPFFLVAIDAASPATVHAWDGRSMVSYEVPDDQIPITTSSFDTDNVVAQRRDRFAAMLRQHGRIDADLLRMFHTSREARGDAYSVFMRRDDAETVSVSHVMVSAESVAFDYAPRAAVESNRPRDPRVLLSRA